MSKFFKLVQNEWTKILKSKASIVMLILLLVVLILIPLAAHFLVPSEEAQGSFSSQLQYFDEFAREAPLDTPLSIEMQKELNKLEKGLLQIAVEQKIHYTDWRASVMHTLVNESQKILAIEYLKKGLKLADMTTLRQPGETLISAYSELTTQEEQNQFLEQTKKETNELLDIFKKGDLEAYTKSQIRQGETELKSVESTLAELQGELKKDEKNTALKKSIESTTTVLTSLKDTLALLNYRLTQRVGFDGKDWRDSALSTIQESMVDANAILLPEEDFIKDTKLQTLYNDYPDYTQKIERSKQEAKNRTLIAEASLKKNAPDIAFDFDDSIRKNMMKDLRLSSFFSIFAIVFGGIAIANEFSKGTIRLLLIRPVTRTKVFFSKLVAILSLTLGLYLVSVVISTVMFGALNSFNGFTNPVFSVVNNVAVEGNFLLYFIQKFFMTTVPIFFFLTLALAISCISRNVAASVALPLGVSTLSIFTLMLFASTDMLKPLLPYTPFPYFNIAEFFSTTPNSTMIHALSSQYATPLSAEFGVAVLFVYSLVCLILSVYFFKSKDITN